MNQKWDMLFLEKLCGGDKEWLKSLPCEEVEEEAGHGGHEVLNWVAMSGAMNGSKANFLLYEPVVEWTCEISYVSYDVEDSTGSGISNG